jgi:hypothetical protein
MREEPALEQPERVMWEGQVEVQGMRVRVRQLEPVSGTRTRCVLELTALDAQDQPVAQAVVDVRNRLEAERLIPVATEAFAVSVRLRQASA